MAKRLQPETENMEGPAAGSAKRVKRDEEGHAVFDISSTRRLSVYAHQGRPVIEIFEYYDCGGVQRKGRNRLKLTSKQWAILVDFSEDIDEALKTL